MRRLYNDFFRSFFIWIELSSSWATVKRRILQWRHVRCWRRRNGKSISRPPSCTIHQTSINPDIYTSTVWKMRDPFSTIYQILFRKSRQRDGEHFHQSFYWERDLYHTFSLDSGNALMPFGTMRAILLAAAVWIASTKTPHDRSCSIDWRQLLGQPNITVLGFKPPSPVDWILWIVHYRNWISPSSCVTRVPVKLTGERSLDQRP